MEDTAIIDLYWKRDERAIEETDRKYGNYCYTVADNILRSREDSEECVSDTWLRAWNSMPPQRPSILRAFLAKITRNLAFDRYRARSAAKRGNGTMEAVLDERVRGYVRQLGRGGSVRGQRTGRGDRKIRERTPG